MRRMVQTPGMMGKIAWFGMFVGLLCGGCASKVIDPQGPDTVIIVPGLGGDGPDYGAVGQALAKAGDPACMQVFNWGYGWVGVFVTIYDDPLHDQTEAKLDQLIATWRTAHPNCRVALIGHSAGCGVILDAVGRLDPKIGLVGPIVLLAPSVSPDYDLGPALAHANVIHAFYSPADTFWLGLAPVIFGDYDATHRYGAGKSGFDLTKLNDDEKKKLVEHPYKKEWAFLGVHGGHFDWLSSQFITTIVAPIVSQPVP
jgi:pimeloyl-ACP methyl ester carboxylesterase